jgi:CRP/FNR family cyclic AMP-dependent transcriptional regulator
LSGSIASRPLDDPPEADVDPARLRNIPVFSDLDDEEIAHIAALAAEVSVPDGKELVREGDYSYDVLAIEEGTATVERDGEHIADLGPGDVVGEMGVLESSQRTRRSRRRLRCCS